jgi:GTPase
MGFTVAIIGRPNVGKSTLFNRLVGRKLALVDDMPGVTRDRRIHDAKLYDLHFQVIDTAGLENAHESSLEGRMRAQTEMAIAEADLVFFMIDAKAGVTPNDKVFGELVRKSGKPFILVANKSESKDSQSGFLDSWQLGLGEPCPISAEHGQGMTDLREAVIEKLGEDHAFGEGDYAPEEVESSEGEDVLDPDSEESTYDDTKPMRVAIVGRPNAGKSTLINTLLGEDRLLTGPEAGITRDSISVEWEFQGRQIKLFDTAGLRRKARIQEKLEILSVGDALRAIRFAEVVVIVLDATIPFEKQDLQIIDLIVREGRAPVVAFNKWDLIEDRQKTLSVLYEEMARLLPQIKGLRAIPVSGELGQGLDKLFAAVIETHKVWNSRISTAKLNRWLEGIVAHHPPPAVSGRRMKIKYMTQAKTRPPGFVISCSRPESMPESYVRYLSNSLRETFRLAGVPLRLMLRTSDNPFAGRAGKKH